MTDGVGKVGQTHPQRTGWQIQALYRHVDPHIELRPAVATQGHHGKRLGKDRKLSSLSVQLNSVHLSARASFRA